MADGNRLAQGMDFDAVRRVLDGWKAEQAGAVMSDDKLQVYHQWDFTPPDGRPERPLRLTFEAGWLKSWRQLNRHR